jgi:ATP-binding cassette subfamily B protein
MSLTYEYIYYLHIGLANLLPPGHECNWPSGSPGDPGLILLEGEVAFIAVLVTPNFEPLERRTLKCFVAPITLPAIPPSPHNLEFRLKVVNGANLISVPAFGDTHTGMAIPPYASLPDPELIWTAYHETGDSPPPPALDAPDQTEIIVRWLCERNGCSLRPLLNAPSDPYERLLALLRQADLIVRPVTLENKDLRNDCGDLIALIENGPLLLLSEDSGYKVRNPVNPQRQSRPLTPKDTRQWNQPWKALEILPTLQPKNLKPRELVYFSFGKARHQGSVFIAATIIGLLIGFALAIGKEVGASRWIAGIGATGALLGIGLALLSNSFRLPLIAAFISTLVGLLVPTINTLLTNVALPEKDVGLMIQMGVLFLAAAIADVGLRWTETRTLLNVQERGQHRLQLAALYRLLSLPISFFRNYKVGELTLRFGAIAQAQDEIRNLLSGGALQSLMTGVFLLFMLRISVKLTGLAVLLAVLLVIPTVLIGRQSLRLERQREECLAEANSRNIELISSVSKLRLTGVEDSAARYWWGPYREAISMQFEVDIRAALASLLSTSMPNLGTLLLFIVITRLAAEANKNPLLSLPNLGQLLGFISAFATFIGAVASLSTLMVKAFELPVLIERAKPILLSKPETNNDNIDPGRLEGKIDFVNVFFCYRDSGPWVINGFNLTIMPGEFVAIVGPTGSGKTTLSRLLLGLETPQQGSILLDGRPLDRLRIELVRRQMGVVTQNTSLLAGSIHEVIAGGVEISPEVAWEAAEAADLAEDIRSLPMGMHTMLPEGGAGLSGGQRQRLAIARALARKPRLLVLDEATSSLDNITQAKVSRNLQSLGITMLIIAHRLSTIRNADRIVVLKQGTVVQEGTFRTLTAKEGPFMQLMQRQLDGEIIEKGAAI